jgi:hypothetical protein
MENRKTGKNGKTEKVKKWEKGEKLEKSVPPRVYRIGHPSHLRSQAIFPRYPSNFSSRDQDLDGIFPIFPRGVKNTASGDQDLDGVFPIFPIFPGL